MGARGFRGRRMRLALKVPPIIVLILVGLTMLAITHVWPHDTQLLHPMLLLWFKVAAGVVAILAAGVGIWPVVQFRLANTTVHPNFPERASKLVTTGIYRYTRNPMYLAMLLALLAWSFWLAQPLPLAGPVLFRWYITRFQIEPEEQVLRDLFGKSFVRYCSEVPRWLL